jgi:AraC-like DNA-binding protein
VGTGLDERALSGAGFEAPVGALLAFVEDLTRRHGAAWPVEAAAVWRAPIQGALDVAIRSAPTGEAALAVAARFARVRAPYLDFRLETTGQNLRLVATPAAPMAHDVWRAVAEAVALSIDALFANVFEEALGEATIDFPWAPPPHADRLRALLGAGLRYGRQDWGFEAPARLCRRPSPFADAGLFAGALAELDAAARRIDQGLRLARDVERMIATALPRRLDADEVSRRLGLSRRTLVRRLAAEGASYRDIVDRVLRERARASLADGALGRDAIAEALGYADATSFSRACRRWFRPSAKALEPGEGR